MNICPACGASVATDKDGKEKSHSLACYMDGRVLDDVPTD